MSLRGSLAVAGENQLVLSPTRSQSFLLGTRVPDKQSQQSLCSYKSHTTGSLLRFCWLPGAEAFVPELEMLEPQSPVLVALLLHAASMQPEGQAHEEMGSSPKRALSSLPQTGELQDLGISPTFPQGQPGAQAGAGGTSPEGALPPSWRSFCLPEALPLWRRGVWLRALQHLNSDERVALGEGERIQH